MFGIFDHRLNTSQPLVPLPDSEKAILALNKAWIKKHHKGITEYPRIKQHYLEVGGLHKQMQAVADLLLFEDDANRSILFNVAKDYVKKNMEEDCHVICLTTDHYRGPDMRFIIQYHVAQTSAFILSFNIGD